MIGDHFWPLLPSNFKTGAYGVSSFQPTDCAVELFNEPAGKISRIGTLTSRAKYQLVTLKRAVRRDGIISRLRNDDGTVRVDIYWKPPRYKRNLARFVGAMPMALIMDLRRVGFASLGAESVPVDGLFETGILWASLASSEGHAEQLAHSTLISYGLANSDQGVVWASRSPRSTPQANRPSPCEDRPLAHSGALAAH